MLKPPRTQDTSTEDVPFDIVSEGKDAATNKLNEDANPNEWFPYDGFDADDSHNDLFITMMRVPYYMPCPYDEGSSSNPPNCMKAIIDRVPTPAQLLKAEGLTPKELSDQHLSAELAKPKEANHALKKPNHSRSSKQDKENFAKGKSQLDLKETELEDLKHQPFIEQSETHKLKNSIIERKRDLFENSSKRTSRDLFENSSRVASLPKHLLVSSPWR
ncbi:hypothetical protein Tco_1169782, partial [Tanacetum coccineum]